MKRTTLIPVLLLALSAQAQAPLCCSMAGQIKPKPAWRLMTVTGSGEVHVSNPMPRQACEFARARVLGEPAAVEEKQVNADRLKVRHEQIEREKVEAVERLKTAPRCYDSKTAEWCTYNDLRRDLGLGDSGMVAITHRNGLGSGSQFVIEDGKVISWVGVIMGRLAVTAPRDIKSAECFQ